MHTLIFGVTGQLGGYLLNEFGSEATCYSREYLDFSKPEMMVSKLEDIYKSNPDLKYILNAAAMTNTGQCEKEKDLANTINNLAVQQLVNFCNDYNLSLIQISTDYVFGGDMQLPYKEEEQKLPLNFYGLTKHFAEEYIQKHMRHYYILRLSSLYSDSPSDNNFVNFVINSLEQGKVINILDDVVMSPTYARDAAELIYQFTKYHFPYGVYHINNTGDTSWYEFAKLIQDYYQHKNKVKLSGEINPIPYRCYKDNIVRPMNSSLDNFKVRKKLIIKTWAHALWDALDYRKRYQ